MDQKLCQMGYITSKQSNKDLRCKDLMITEKQKHLFNKLTKLGWL